MTIPPHGAVTFLFTDVEGSSKLWELHPDAMQSAVARHDDILRRAVLDHGGYIAKMHSDGIFAAFASPSDALHAALRGQHALSCEAWPAGATLKARMALHTGAAGQRDGDYFGPNVNRAARLVATGHGGQILLSAATRDRLQSTLPDGVILRDLGLHRLKDLIRPERIYQVTVDSLPASFPPLMTISVQPNVLPIQLTPFIGRAREMARCLALLRRADVRLLTLTGPGGSGKTRLALQVAADLLDSFDSGVFFVDLSAMRDPTAVPLAIARVLKIPDIGGVDPMTSLTAFLREKQALLVLDNCEQILPAGVYVSQLLTACAGIKAVATSRAPLRLPAEHTYPVPPLAVPDIRALPPLAALEQVEAVQLFVQRSAAVRPDFTMTDASARAVAEICVRLDGLPLAIELAAARSRTLPPHDLLAQLNPSLPTLTAGFYDLPTRHQALRNTIAWSYALLTEDEQRIFRRLGVFAGGWTAEAAAAVCADDSVIAILLSLADNNLIRRQEQAAGSLRFTMLQTVREYALERLDESGELAGAQERHAHYYAGFAEEAEQHIFPRQDVAWFDRVQTEMDNLRAVWRWSAENDRAGIGLGILAAIHPIALVRDWAMEWKRWYETLLALPSGQIPSEMRARALNRLGHIVGGLTGQTEQANRLHDEAAAVARTVGAPAAEAYALALKGVWVCHADLARGRELLEQAKAISKRGSTPELDLFLHTIDILVITTFTIDPAEVATLAETALAYCREQGSRLTEAMVIGNLGLYAMKHLRDPELALRRFAESNALVETLGARLMIDIDAHIVCGAYMRAGNVAKAEEVALAAYQRLSEYGDPFRPAVLLRWAGTAALERGDLVAAKERFEHAMAMLEGRDQWWVHLPVRRGLATIARQTGDAASEQQFLCECLRITRNHLRGAASAIDILWFAREALAEREPLCAAGVLAAMENLKRVEGLPSFAPPNPDETRRLQERIRGQAGDAAFAQAWALGLAMTREQALDCALAALGSAEPAPSAS